MRPISCSRISRATWRLPFVCQPRCSHPKDGVNRLTSEGWNLAALWALPPWDKCVASRPGARTVTEHQPPPGAFPAEEDPEFTRTRLPGHIPGKELCAAGPIPRSSSSGNAEKARNPACQAPGPSAPAFGCRKLAGGNALPVGGKSRSCCSAASQAAASCHRRCAPLPQPQPCASAAAAWPGSCSRHCACRGAGREGSGPVLSWRGRHAEGV